VVLDEQYATHYYRGDREPFQNLSEVEDGDVDAVLATLAGGSRRRFGPRYLKLRQATEARARDLFIEAGGHPIRNHPHYFVLGRSPWFAGLYDDPHDVRVLLSELPPEATSFTWTDSITALGLGTHLGVPQPAEPGKRALYRLDQLGLSTADFPVPSSGDAYEGYQQQLLDHYVEIQLWTDEPVAPSSGLASPPSYGTTGGNSQDKQPGPEAVTNFFTGSRASLRSAAPSGSACPRCAAGRFACGLDPGQIRGAGSANRGRVWWQGGGDPISEDLHDETSVKGASRRCAMDYVHP